MVFYLIALPAIALLAVFGPRFVRWCAFARGEPPEMRADGTWLFSAIGRVVGSNSTPAQRFGRRGRLLVSSTKMVWTPKKREPIEIPFSRIERVQLVLSTPSTSGYNTRGSGVWCFISDISGKHVITFAVDANERHSKMESEGFAARHIRYATWLFDHLVAAGVPHDSTL